MLMINKLIFQHAYYTTKLKQMQAKMDIFTIFVNYDYFYVNKIM